IHAECKEELLMRPWDDVLADVDREVIRLGGYGQPRGFGQRPAVLIIDVQYFMVGEDRPLLEQIGRYPSGCGEAAWRCVRRMQPLLERARAVHVPLVYVRTAQRYSTRFYWSTHKTKRDQSRYLDGHPDADIVREIAPIEGDTIADKTFPDAFLGTPLQAYLI